MPQKSLRVKSRFEASENISSTARKIERNTRRLNKNMKRGFRESTRSALKFKSVLKSILAASVIQKGFGMLSQGVQSVTRQFIGFDDAIVAAAVRFKDIGPDAANFNQQLKTIKKSAREAGQTTIFTAEQAAVALDFLARAGFTSVEAMGSLNSMINLSIASGEDFAQVADFSSDLLGSFGLAAKDSGQKIANLNRLNDVLVKTVNSANVKVEDLFETMTQVGPVATGVLGSSLEEAASFAAILGNSGIKSSQAMTALKNIFLRLAAPAAAGEQTLKALGLTLDDGTGKAKGMTAFMEEMGEKLKGFGQIDQAKILDAVFGKRAIAGAKIIFDNIEAVKDFRKELDNAAGTSQKTSDIMQTSLGNRIKGLGSALTELGFKVLDPFEKRIKNTIVSLTEFFRGADTGPFVTSIKKIIDTISPLFETSQENFKTFKDFFQETGVFDTMLRSVTVAVSTVKTLSKLIGPTLERLKPVVNFLNDSLNKTFDLIDRANKLLEKKIDRGAERKLTPSDLARDLERFGGRATGLRGVVDDINRLGLALQGIEAPTQKQLDAATSPALIKFLDPFSVEKEPRKIEFKDLGLLPLIISKFAPEFAARRTDELAKELRSQSKQNIEPVKVQIKPLIEPAQLPVKPIVEPVKLVIKPIVEPIQLPVKPNIEPVKEDKELRPQFQPNIEPIRPQVETQPVPDLNVNVNNNIKGNDVEVETEVEVPETSGGQGRNKI